MINKDAQQQLKRELIDGFKVFYNSLYQHEKVDKLDEAIKTYIEDINELISICDDLSLKVKFVCTMPDGTEKHTKYQDIQNFSKDGIDIVEGVERIVAHIKAVAKKRDVEYVSSDDHPFFKSETFVLEENVKSKVSKLLVDSIKRKESKSFVINIQDLQEFSGNRIRFEDNKTLEL